MAVTLSESDIQAMRDFSARLLAIVDTDDLEAWAESVLELVRPVFGADRAFLVIPHGETVLFSCSDADMNAAANSYMIYSGVSI